MPQSYLEGAAHLTVELVLLLCHLHVILRSRLHTEECVFTTDALVSLSLQECDSMYLQFSMVDCNIEMMI